MKRNTLSNLLLALGLVLALGSGIVMARRTLAQGPGAQGPLGVSNTLGTAFTYQGRLTDTGGVPLSGDYDFQFQLYDALSGDTPVGSAVAVGDKEVTDGYFTAQLDFGNVFDGTALWLEVKVRPGAETGAYTALNPRQALTAAPYARYAAVAPWSGLNGVPAGLDDGDDDTTYSAGTGLTLVGATFSVDFAGSGSANTAARSDHNHDGVYAPATHDHWGEAWSGTGAGLTLFGGDTGLDASGSAYGVRAGGNTADLRLDGVSGIIYAKGEPQSDLELYSNEDVDVHLDDAGYTPNAHFRVLDDADAVVFEVDETGAVSWPAQTGYVSIPATAFGPKEDGYNFLRSGNIRAYDATSRYYGAPVQLPHGATVTRMTYYFYDHVVGDDTNTTLYRSTYTTGAATAMASASSSGTPGSSSAFDDMIDHATVDNMQYGYYLWLDLSAGGHGTSLMAYGVVIEYTYTGPY